MRLILRVIGAIVMAAICAAVIDVVALFAIVATGNAWILLGIVGGDIVIFAAFIANTVIRCHDRGIYLRG